MNDASLPLAVRAYAEPIETGRPRPRAANAQSAKRRYVDPARRPETILVFDCETRVDASQVLLFGVYRYYGLEWQGSGPQLSCLEEGLLYADELALHDPDVHQTLERYARTRRSASAEAPRLRLLSRDEFVKKVFLPALAAQATVVTFNAPFDLDRMEPWPRGPRRPVAGREWSAPTHLSWVAGVGPVEPHTEVADHA